MTGSPPTRAWPSRASCGAVRTHVLLMLSLRDAPPGCSRAQPLPAQRFNSHFGSQGQVSPVYRKACGDRVHLRIRARPVERPPRVAKSPRRGGGVEIADVRQSSRP